MRLCPCYSLGLAVACFACVPFPFFSTLTKMNISTNAPFSSESDDSTASSTVPSAHPFAVPQCKCTFVTGPRGAGKTSFIQQHLRSLATAQNHNPARGTVGVLLAEEGRVRSESLSSCLPGLVLRRLILPCHCCPELARLPSVVRSLVEANPQLGHIFIEVPDVTALRFLSEFDSSVGWERSMVLCINQAWAKGRRIQMLAPHQIALFDMANEIVGDDSPVSDRARAMAHEHPSPTTAPFHLSL